MPSHRSVRIVALAVGLALIAACGSDAGGTSPESEAPATDAPTTEPPVTDAPTTEPPATDVQPATDPAATDVQPAAWSEIVPDDPDCACSDGSEFRFFERVADPTKVVLFFEGGGACFSKETCQVGAPTQSYSATIDADTADLADFGGLLDPADDRNPLADHSVVYVPYCTGDVHIGNATTDYGDGVVIEHRGYVNGLAALEHLVEQYPEATQLVVTGRSAGSVPTPLFAGLAADRLPDADIVTLGDSSGAYPDVPPVNEAIGGLWGTTDAIPDWPVNDGLTAADWSFPDLYVQAGLHAPDVRFGRFDYAYDEVQATFGALAGVAADDLVTLIDETEAQVEAGGPDLSAYVAPGTAHTIIGNAEVYELTVEGVPLIDWITTLVDGDDPGDVRCTDCAPPEAIEG